MGSDPVLIATSPSHIVPSMFCSQVPAVESYSHLRPMGCIRLLVVIWALMAAALEMVPPILAQETADKIARLADDQLSSKEARLIAHSLDVALALKSLPPEQIGMLLASLVQARAKFRYDKATAKSLDALAIEVLKYRDPEGHILGKDLRQIIDNPNYLRREEAFRVVLQFFLDAHIQPSEFFDALESLDPDEPEDRDLIKRNADLTKKFLITWPHAASAVSADLAEAVPALSGPWSQMSEDQIIRYVKVVGDVLGSLPVHSAVDYVTALELVSRKQVLSAMAKKTGTWLDDGKYQAIIAFAASVHALVISEIAQDPNPQLKLIDEEKRVESFFTFVTASNKIKDLAAKDTCEKAADDLFQQNLIAITDRVLRIAQEQSAVLAQDPKQQVLLAQLYPYYEYQAQLSVLKAAKPFQVPAYVYQDPHSPAKVAKRLQVFAGLNQDDFKRLAPAVVTLQDYFRTGIIPEDSDFRRYVLVEAAKAIPHLLLSALWDQWLDQIGEWMSRSDLNAEEAKVFADWMFSAPLLGDRLEKAYSFIFTASSNFKVMDPAVLALRLSAADLLKNQDREGAVLGDYLARVLMTSREAQSLRNVQDILKTFRAAHFLPLAARKVIQDVEFQDPEIRALRELMIDEHFPTSLPPTDPPSEPHPALAAQGPA